MKKYRFIYSLLIVGCAFSCQSEDDFNTVGIMPFHSFVEDFIPIDSGQITTINVFDNDTLDDRFEYKLYNASWDLTEYDWHTEGSLDTIHVQLTESGVIIATSSHPIHTSSTFYSYQIQTHVGYRIKNSDDEWRYGDEILIYDTK